MARFVVSVSPLLFVFGRLSATVSSLSDRNARTRAGCTRPWLLLVLVSILFSLPAPAQSSLVSVVGVPTDATMYPIPGLGFVNLNNGNFHLEIPLSQVQERNGVTETANLVYDNSFYLIGTRTGPPVQEYWTTLGQGGGAFNGNLRIEVSPNYVRSIPVTNTGVNYQCGNNVGRTQSGHWEGRISGLLPSRQGERPWTGAGCIQSRKHERTGAAKC